MEEGKTALALADNWCQDHRLSPAPVPIPFRFLFPTRSPRLCRDRRRPFPHRQYLPLLPAPPCLMLAQPAQLAEESVPVSEAAALALAA